MRSLFWKIFCYFLLIIILIVSVGITLTLLRDQEFPPLAHQSFARQAIAEYGRNVVAAHTQGGDKSVDQYIDRVRRKSGIELTVIDQDGRSLSSRRAPRRMRHMLDRAMGSGEIVRPMMGNRNAVAGIFTAADGSRFLVSVALPEQPKPKELISALTHGFLGWKLLVLLAITAVVCWILARSLTSPIKRLRKATCRFADGDLTTRIGNEIKGGNEFAELARDFDDMAIKIEDLVGSQQRLLRDISHELRSPLARLSIALELARKQQTNGDDKALNRIELETERMNEMIGQLLSLTRLESDMQGLQKSTFDLAALLERLVHDADFEAAAKESQVVFKGQSTLRWNGHEELLARALENVMRNAVKYTSANSEVEVVLHVTADHILIQVLDAGPGVPEEALEKLFIPFFRVADDRDRKSGGTGIGLAIAERAVKLHGGMIKAENRSEGGLKIEINLPFKV